MGNPAVNVALLPYVEKNAYNAASAKADASLTFANDIIATITQLGLGTSQQNIGLLAGIAVFFGDILILDTSAAPTNGYPNGRRLQDDVIDTILSVLANGAVSDGVNANDLPFQTDFPFLALPHQPLDNGVDDATRN